MGRRDDSSGATTAREEDLSEEKPRKEK